jgi:hypothetical protein
MERAVSGEAEGEAMNRRNLFRSALGAAIFAVAERLGLDEKVRTMDDLSDHDLVAMMNDCREWAENEVYRHHVLGDYKVRCVVKPSALVERDYP